jgi:dGTPase
VTHPSLHYLQFPANCASGRRYLEPRHPFRNEFQRDRDRVVHARAFRRLENKTQVFAAGVSDHFRNRLTHTLEVSQIARTVARVLELDEDFTEALALAHDIGHPPFAHAGETELNRQMERFGEHFDHNLHALRIVETFEHRYARFPGLNLTFETREGIVKHSRDFEPGEIPELDEFLPGLRPPLEAQLIDLCDEVAYNTADLDDAWSAKLLTVEALRDEVPRFSEIYEETVMHFPGAPEQIRFSEAVRSLLNWLVGTLIEGTYQAAAAAGVQTVEDVRRFPRRLVNFLPGVTDTTGQLRAMLRRYVYLSDSVAAERRDSREKIAGLFDFFLENPDELPEKYREERDRQPLHRTICDYIAGMTDGYFLRTYRQKLCRSPE